MNQTSIQVLQTDLQGIAKTATELATRISVLSRHLGSFNASDMEDLLSDEYGWIFEKNNYSQLVTFLTSDRWALENKCKHKTESWPVYAVRISKYVGWEVDENTLRQCFQRRMAYKK